MQYLLRCKPVDQLWNIEKDDLNFFFGGIFFRRRFPEIPVTNYCQVLGRAQ